jgi:DNA invertase Pin-like site-specific DNA recombinase
LVVAKLDRLARNVAFTAALQDAGVKFVCCDNPSANEMTINILASVAQGEAKAISERTKAALAAATAKGTKLGSHRPGHWTGREHLRLAGLAKARERAAEASKRAADEAYTDIFPLISAMRTAGSSLQKIADELTAMGHTTRRGKPWNPMQVLHVLKRAA